MEKPMTTEELFNKIQDILKEKNKLPDILDYGLAAHRPVPITNYEFGLKSNLDYGGSEGIYLDLWIEGKMNEEMCRHGIGTFKTLSIDNEAMHIMAGLLADFLIEMSAYVNAHLDDFTWEGADVYGVDEAGRKRPWGYSCRTMTRALEKKDELLEKYPKVIVRDNAARKETIYKKGGTRHDSMQ